MGGWHKISTSPTDTRKLNKQGHGGERAQWHWCTTFYHVTLKYKYCQYNMYSSLFHFLVITPNYRRDNVCTTHVLKSHNINKG